MNSLKTICGTALLSALAAVSQPGRGELLLDANGIHFGPGDTLELAIGLNDTANQTDPVDAYFAIITPDGNSLLFVSGSAGNPTLTPGLLSEPSTWTPLASRVVLKNIGDTKLIPYLNTTLPEGVPTGDYRIAFATTLAGTLNVVESQFLVVRVLENSIKGHFGKFTGEWNNNTFNASGPVSFELDEVAPGILEGSLSFGGFAAMSWDSETGTETRQVQLADFSGLIDYETEDPLIDGTYSVTYTPAGHVTLEVTDIGFAGYFGVTANGNRNGDAIEIDYEVTAGFGSAQGTISGQRQADSQ